MSTKVGWMREQEAKATKKGFENRGNEHSEWMQKRDSMIKKREEAELKAKQAEENAPEFLKKLGTMKEKAQSEPTKKEDEGPTIEELDDGTDIPPWHREGAPEKPEWVVLLLMAAEKEALEEEEEDEHVYVAPTPAYAAKISSRIPPKSEKPEKDDKPGWMKQAEKKRSLPTFGTSEKEDEKPEWMKQAENLRSMSSRGTNAGPPESPSPKPTKSIRQPQDDEQPEWMQNAKKVLNRQPTSQRTPDRVKSAEDTTENMPEWMKNAARIKKRPESKREPRVSKDDSEKFRLKPRVSTEDLQSSKVKEKLKSRMPPRKPSLTVTKDELRHSKVQKKLANKPVMPQRPAIVDKKEMEFMKKRLKPRGRLPASQPTDSSASDSQAKEPPEWMKHASNIKQKGREEENVEKESEEATAPSSSNVPEKKTACLDKTCVESEAKGARENII
jgi:hypothetical protein